MSRAFDIGVEALAEQRITGKVPAMKVGHTSGSGTFFLERVDCQMNDDDSEKVAGLLLARGYRQVDSPEAASLVLYNTCSIREKAAQKVFSRLGEYQANHR